MPILTKHFVDEVFDRKPDTLELATEEEQLDDIKKTVKYHVEENKDLPDLSDEQIAYIWNEIKKVQVEANVNVALYHVELSINLPRTRKLTQFFVNELFNNRLEMVGMSDAQRCDFIKNIAKKHAFELFEEHIPVIWEHIKDATQAPDAVALARKLPHPNAVLVIQMLMSGVANYMMPNIVPGLLASIGAHRLMTAGLTPLLGTKSSLAATVASFGLGWFTAYNPFAMGNAILSELAENMGSMGYLVPPATMLLWSKGPTMLKALEKRFECTEVYQTVEEFAEVMMLDYDDFDQAVDSPKVSLR